MAAGIDMKGREEEIPIPYRVLDKDYMATQLPSLQEKSPDMLKTQLNYPTNAPNTLPSPSLFPGEILRMQQHRVICTNAFEEPAVGMVYLTNFRIIFNGSPVSDPDVYGIIHELQLQATSKKDSLATIHQVGSIPRTLARMKKPSLAPRISKFYVGNNDDQLDADDENETADIKNPSISAKLFQRLHSLRRSTGAGIKTAIGDFSTDITKKKSIRSASIPVHTLTVPLSHSKSAESGLDTMAEDTPSLDKVATMPKVMSGHHGNLTVGTPTNQHCQTADSGIVDTIGNTPTCESPPVFTGNIDEVDFERAPIDFPLKDPRRSSTKTPTYKRPESLIAIDSDSADSDTNTDKYFGSITDLYEDEEEDDDVSIVLSPPSSHNYENVVLSLNKEDTSEPKKEESVKEKERKDEEHDASKSEDSVKSVPPVKPPRKKKHKLSNEDASSPTTTKSKELISNGLSWKRSHSDTVSTRRRPPPPPPSSLTHSHADDHTSEISKRSCSDPNLLNLVDNTPHNDDVFTLSPTEANNDPPKNTQNSDRTSSLLVERGSTNNYRHLSICTPREPCYTFDWPDRSTKSDSGSSSLPLIHSTVMPYYQYSHSVSMPLATVYSVKHVPQTTLPETGLKIPDGVLILGKNFSSLKMHFHPNNTYDSLKFKDLLEGIISNAEPVYDSFAFKYRSAIRLHNPHVLDSRKLSNFYNFDNETARIGILEAKIKNSQLWRVTSLTKTNPELCPSYPEKLVVLICTPDVDLLRSVNIYQEGRFPTACWMNKSNGSVLLRAASTTSERGLQGSNLPVDEAILQAIRGCNTNSRLFVFTERSDTASFQDPTKLTVEAARSYYYHNCNFVFSVNPPTYKSIRHSFNKLQAMFQNNVTDDEYLVELDGTKWLSRIGELLSTAYKVVEALTIESAHVLVCYEKGWDRTTQIVSLAQLLCDPYYRTVDGFQVLIQKEWLWFGHPFQTRHCRHNNSKLREDAPVFLQWIDCVWQIMRQCPFAFEFNENLLIALVEHCYSNQFGTFLRNFERERSQSFMVPEHYHQSVNSNTVSLWTWIAMVNASNKIFYNSNYDPEFHPSVIFPKYYQTCLEIWRVHYDKYNWRKETQEGFVNNGRLHSELRQLIRLFKERQPDLSILSLHVGLNENLLYSVASLMSTASFTNEKLPAGPNPLPTVPAAVSKPERVYSSVREFLIEEGYDPSICHHLSLSESICQGYLTKEGGFRKNWKKRWFVLDYTTEYLAYFISQEHFNSKEKPKGVISLNQIKKVSLSTRRLHLMSNYFQIRTPVRTYNIKAPSILSLEIWIACLRLSPTQLDCKNIS